MDKVTAAQKSKELESAVTKAYEDLTSLKITEAEFNQICENAEKENERVSVLFKSRQRANQFTQPEQGAPPEEDDAVRTGLKEYQDEFGKMASAARRGSRGTGSFHFGLKSAAERDDGVRLKATGTTMPVGPYQGVTGLTGEGATSNNIPVGLVGGTYFLA